MLYVQLTCSRARPLTISGRTVLPPDADYSAKYWSTSPWRGIPLLSKNRTSEATQLSSSEMIHLDEFSEDLPSDAGSTTKHGEV